MNEATIIYPHQLFEAHPGVRSGRKIYLVEESLLLTHNPIHRQKLLFHFDTLDYYEELLRKKKYEVIRLSIHSFPTTNSIFSKIKSDGVDTIHVTDTTDDYLEKAISQSGLKRIWYESPLFIIPKDEAIDRFIQSGKFMARFYKKLRIDKNILITKEKKPVGGEWSFDKDNRKKIPRHTPLPHDISISPVSQEDIQKIRTIKGEHYGEIGRWLPTNHETASAYLEEFFNHRFELFGDYEDAIRTDHHRLWHSTISPLLNVGLLTPKQVLESALTFADNHMIPINSLEGFVRQVLGWREFIRASYERDGRTMRNKNFFTHTRPIPHNFWNGTTGLIPIDHTVSTVLRTGYTHHIERLMVMGNGFLLLGINPHDVYRWFMGMYVDAYDWVMVPNVYGMSQFSDGGSFATKPYISGANYLSKMSNYPKGDWEEKWTALYWNFIHSHRDEFLKNHRLNMMPRLLEKMTPEKRHQYLATADRLLTSLD
jgi:deoxyribodipyrimidine photolyase-related protein